MEEIKAFSILSSLSPDELRQFNDYVISPYFNKSKEVSDFYRILHQSITANKPTSKEEVFKKLYPKQKFDSRKISDISYPLLKLLKDYLADKNYRRKELLRKNHLLDQAQEARLEKLVNDTSKDLLQALEQGKVKNADTYYQSFLFYDATDRYNVVTGKIKSVDMLQAKIDNLDKFYLAEKLAGCCEMLNRGKILQTSYHMNMLQEVMGYLETPDQNYTDEPAIKVYLCILNLLRESEPEQQFILLMQYLNEYHDSFTEVQLREMYGYAQNYCIGRINAGDSSYYERLLQLYQRLLETKLIYQDGTLGQWDYKNIVSLALRLGKYEWTLKFIEDYKPELPEKQRKNAYTYNIANYYYELKNYKQAIKLLQSVEYSDVYYRLDATTMLLKMYFEMEEEDLFNAQSAAFKIYLKRNKLISARNYTLYMNLAKLSSTIFKMKMKLPYQKNTRYYKKLAELKSKITTTADIANSKWLLEKITELESGKAS